SVGRMARDIGPNCEVPAMRAGGAVELPLPSIWTLTFGYIFKKASAQNVIRLFIVSEPTLLTLPEMPEVFWYEERDGSALTCANAGPPGARPRSPIATCFMCFLFACDRRFPVLVVNGRPGRETGRFAGVNSGLNGRKPLEVEKGLDLEPLLLGPGEERVVL